MSNKIMISNNKISEYLGTEDAIQGLQKVVDNGQTRLALEVIFDIVTQLTDKISTLEEILSAQKDSSPTPAPAPAQEKPITKVKETITVVPEEEKK
jgi:hypothetical protein